MSDFGLLPPSTFLSPARSLLRGPRAPRPFSTSGRPASAAGAQVAQYDYGGAQRAQEEPAPAKRVYPADVIEEEVVVPGSVALNGQRRGLPVGWEERVDEGGRTYWFDRIHRVSTWDDPRGPKPAPVLSLLSWEPLSLPSKSAPAFAHLVRPGRCFLAVRRDHAVLDSLLEIMNRLTPDELRQGLVVVDSDRVDEMEAEGFFQLLSQTLFDPAFGLFTTTGPRNTYLIINPQSGTDRTRLERFRFIGRVLGIFLVHGLSFRIRLAPVVFKLFLGRPVSPADLELQDPTLSSHLVFIAETHMASYGPEEDFVDEVTAAGVRQVVELKPDGRNIPLTEANKGEYIRLLREFRLHGRVREQTEALRKGLEDLVPREDLKGLDERQLAVLLYGPRRAG